MSFMLSAIMLSDVLSSVVAPLKVLLRHSGAIERQNIGIKIDFNFLQRKESATMKCIKNKKWRQFYTTFLSRYYCFSEKVCFMAV